MTATSNENIDIKLTVEQTFIINNILDRYYRMIRDIIDGNMYKNISDLIFKLDEIVRTNPYNNNIYYISMSISEINLLCNILDKYKYVVRDIIPKPNVIFIADIIYDIKYQLITESKNV